jgi:hypothetical protein
MYNLAVEKGCRRLRMEDIVVMLQNDRDAVIRAIDVLKDGATNRRRRRRRLSAAARRRISEGMKRRWAARKKKAS